jgi:hypothetical protein
MRCLYCGGELALLKKLRGGGSFCSEAHRQKYQEEYSQLALSRLMQANPKAEKRAPAPRVEPPLPSAPPSPRAAVVESPKAPAAVLAPCGFLLPNIEPRDCATPLFSHGPMPLDWASAGPHEHAPVAVCTLPRAEAFRPVALTLSASDPCPAAPEYAAVEIWPEFKETTAGWLTPNFDDAPSGETNLDAEDTSVCTTAVETPAAPRTAPRRAVEFLPVTLRLAPPPNSGPQDTCRPAAFPPAAPELPAVKMNPLRLRFGFGPAPESKRAPEPVHQECAAAPEPILTLGAPVEKRSKLPLLLSVAGALALVAGGGMFLFTRGNASAPATHHKTHTAPAPIAETDWTTDWSGKPPKGERLSILRPSLNMSDYRIEFQGQIESKSLGWIFRATDPKNYYALRLEIAKPGAMAEIALARTVVEAGQQKDRAHIPLRTKFARDTVFKIRTDVQGSTFRTWIQGDLVDTWTDTRFKTGAFGLLTDAAGRAKLQMIQLSELDNRADAIAHRR